MKFLITFCYTCAQNIDLHALTGWIPERVSLTGAVISERERTFRMLCDRHSRGDVLVTVATGELSDAEAERTGLVPTHAYAVLDVRLVLNKRLFLLKNPWSHLRWKGNYSERDLNNWTPALKEALKYEPQSARNFDNVRLMGFSLIKTNFDCQMEKGLNSSETSIGFNALFLSTFLLYFGIQERLKRNRNPSISKPFFVSSLRIVTANWNNLVCFLIRCLLDRHRFALWLLRCLLPKLESESI